MPSQRLFGEQPLPSGPGEPGPEVAASRPEGPFPAPTLVPTNRPPAARAACPPVGGGRDAHQTDSQRLDVFRLGRVGYAEALAAQRALQAGLVAARHDADGPAHALLIVEHPPVFTLGTSGHAANVTASAEALAARGAAVVRTDRGGDVTFHGPGQIVAYPILDLNRLAVPGGESLRDLHRYLRALEDAVIDVCAGVGVAAGRVAARTGVWVGLPTSAGTGSARGAERKVCAMGIRCSRWVTMHGLALNVDTDLAWFDLIVPCGIADRGVTSLRRESEGFDAAHVERDLIGRIAHHVGAAPHVYADGRAALTRRLADEARPEARHEAQTAGV